MRAWLFLWLLGAVGVLCGCTTTNNDNVSSIPWNRPQTWEGTGSLGGLASH